MSYREAPTPDCEGTQGAIKYLISPKERDLGEFTVKRVLPALQQRMVGPFIFFDHMGPAEFPPGESIQVRPHPHIGISTITYLFEGQIMHHDSLDCHQLIQPGAVNLMTAGSGIVHSERPGEDLEDVSRLHGIQSWMALPDGAEEIAPSFTHYPETELPRLLIEGCGVRVIIGEAYGYQSPVTQYLPTLYLDCKIPEGKELMLPENVKELAVYVVDGDLQIADQRVQTGVMAVAEDNQTFCLRANRESRVMVVGGDPVGERHIWWNFVSSSRARIEQAKADWQENRFDKVPGETEFIPLPPR